MPKPVLVKDAFAQRSIAVTGDLSAPGTPLTSVAVRWVRYDFDSTSETENESEGYLEIESKIFTDVDTRETPNGAEIAALRTGDTRAIRALAELLTRLAERVEADEFDGRD